MPRIIASAINAIARQTIGKDWLLYAALLDHWQEIVGQEYAEVTIPVKISFPHQPLEARRQNGTLTIRLPKGLAMEFSFKGELIKQRINGYFGYDAIARIAFDPVPSITSPKPPSFALSSDSQRLTTEALKEMPTGELRDALQSFGQTLFSAKTRPPQD